jgi:hypothetical protein
MALAETGLDFSAETWDTAAEFYPGCWVIANRHCPGLNTTMELNNRVFVFRIENRDGKEQLLVFGCAAKPTVEAVKSIEKETGLEVAWVVSNGGAHHMFLDLWYQAFPKARIPIPAKRIPFTRNGKNLKEKYADRWELLEGPKPGPLLDEVGEHIDIVIFDQLFGYKDESSAKAFDGGALDHSSKPTSYGSFKLMRRFPKLMKDTSQPNDEVALLHRKSGLVIAGHNFPFAFVPKGFKPTKEHKLNLGPFPIGFMLKMMMMKPGAFRSMLEAAPGPIADSKAHCDAWESVLSWDIGAWTTAHDPPTVCGPDMNGDEIKAAIRASLKRSGEDDPSGARLKWNIKNKKN